MASLEVVSKHLHIVSFDVPWPANYGGVIDVYYKLVALKAQGIRVTLHCFAYGRKPARELDRLCDKVVYYRRRTGLISNFSIEPYTVRSRRSRELERNLLQDSDPIVFEVLHTCYLLGDPRFAGRRMIYRHSNIEHHYYSELARMEKSALKKLFFRIEAWKLKRFERVLRHADAILAVNQKDADHFRRIFPKVQTVYIPSFHPNTELSAHHGKGTYLLFHGNLSVSENYSAAAWLIEHVFKKLDYPCVIAGMNPPAFLLRQAAAHGHIRVVADPSDAKMKELVANAQVHVLYTAQPTGLKLKLLNVLFNGRFVVCNHNMLSGTTLKANHGLLIGDQGGEMLRRIESVLHNDFTDAWVAERKQLVAPFDNAENCRKLLSVIF